MSTPETMPVMNSDRSAITTSLTTVGEFMPGGNGTGIREYLASKDSQYADVKPVHEFGMTENRVYFENKDESVTDFYLKRNPEYNMYFYDDGRILSAEMVQTIQFADSFG